MSERSRPECLASQSARIADWAMGHVIHQDDWYAAGADGGAPIKAVRSRVSELERERGFGFHHIRRPDGTVEYRLAHVPDVEQLGGLVEAEREAAAPDNSPHAERLFEPAAPAAEPRNAALFDYCDEDAA